MSEEEVGFSLRRLIDEDRLSKDIQYNSTNLSSAMMDQAGLYVYYGGLSAKASRQVDDLKMLLEVTESTVDKALRDQAVADGEKITEASLGKKIAMNTKVIKINKLLNEARHVERLCLVALEAFKQRRDMLVQAGLMMREEMKGEVSISRRQTVEEETRAAKRRLEERLSKVS